MLSAKVYKEFDKATQSDGFKTMKFGIERAFPSDEFFANWVYAGGVNLYTYVKAIEDKSTLDDLVAMITDVLKTKLTSKDIKAIKSDKSAYKFISNWMKTLGQTDDKASKLNHLTSGKRNFYSHFLCILLTYTTVDTSGVDGTLTEEEIKEQEFEMISPEDLEVQTEDTETELIEA